MTALELLCTVIPNGVGSSGLPRVLVEVSPRCKNCLEFQPAWREWGNYLLRSVQETDDIWTLEIDNGVGSVAARFASRTEIDETLWNTILKDSMATCEFSPPPEGSRQVMRNYLTAASRWQQVRYSSHFDTLSQAP